MHGYPQIPVRAKVRMAPYLILLVIGFGVAEDWGLIDATGQQTTTRPHHRKPKATPVPKVTASDIPRQLRPIYQQAGARYGVSPLVLAAIGKVESDHGRSSAPGVHSGVNRFGCCAGHMQFNIRNGHGGGIEGSTWDTYGDGIRSHVYQPRYAIPAAARLLKANGYGDEKARRSYRRCSINARPGSINAIRHYNNACWYVAEVLTIARRYQKGA